LVQGFKSNNFEIQIKDYLDSKQRTLDQGELNLTKDFEFKGRFENFKEQKLNKESFEICFGNQKLTSTQK
jgi:hypothetical protein